MTAIGLIRLQYGILPATTKQLHPLQLDTCITAPLALWQGWHLCWFSYFSFPHFVLPLSHQSHVLSSFIEIEVLITAHANLELTEWSALQNTLTNRVNLYLANPQDSFFLPPLRFQPPFIFLWLWYNGPRVNLQKWKKNTLSRPVPQSQHLLTSFSSEEKSDASLLIFSKAKYAVFCVIYRVFR